MGCKFGKFSYKIDYDKAIAEDERLIGLWDGPLAKSIAAGLSAEEIGWRAQGFLRNALELLTAGTPERRSYWPRVFGLSDRTLAIVIEIASDRDDRDDALSNAVGLTADRKALNEGECALIAKMRAEGAATAVWLKAVSEYRKNAGATLAAEYAAARAEIVRLEAIDVASEEDRLGHLKHAKTSLARHRRNKDKWGEK